MKKTEGKDETTLLRKVKDEAEKKGVRLGDVASEVIRMLPENFVLQYEWLWLRGLKGSMVGGGAGDPDSATGPAVRVTRTSTSQTETRGAAKSGGRRQGVSGRSLLGDTRAVAYRSRIDRKLRALAREMAAWAEGSERGSVRRCTRCRVWAENDWNFCPRDGAATEEV